MGLGHQQSALLVDLLKGLERLTKIDKPCHRASMQTASIRHKLFCWHWSPAHLSYDANAIQHRAKPMARIEPRLAYAVEPRNHWRGVRPQLAPVYVSAQSVNN